MTGVSMQVTIDDLEVRAAFNALAERAESLHPALDAIGEAMVSKTQLRFAEQHGPDGAKWLPSERALRTGGQTLIETARLMMSQTHNVIGDNGVEWGTNVIYAAIHQNGGTIDIYARGQEIYRKVGKDGAIGNLFVKKSKSNFASHVEIGDYKINMPARPFVGIDEEDRAEIKGTLADFLAKAVPGGAA